MDTLSNPESMLTRLRPAPNDTLVGEKKKWANPQPFSPTRWGGNGRCKQTKKGGGHASVRFPLNNFKFFELSFQSSLHLSLAVLVRYRASAGV